MSVVKWSVKSEENKPGEVEQLKQEIQDLKQRIELLEIASSQI